MALLLEIEQKECSRRLNVYQLTHDKYGDVTESGVVEDEIIFYQQGGLESNRGKNAAFPLGLTFKARYTISEWKKDMVLFNNGELPKRVYVPLNMDDETIFDWLMVVTKERYKKFLYSYVTGFYRKLIRYYFKFVTDAMVRGEHVEKCKQLIEWTSDFWWMNKRINYDMCNLTSQKISKNYLEKLRATCNQINQVKSVKASFTLTPFDIAMEQNYSYGKGGYRRREVILKKNIKHTCNVELYAAEFIMCLWFCHRDKTYYDPTTLFSIMALKQNNVVHKLYHGKELIRYNHYQCDERNKITDDSYKLMLALTAMCRAKNTPNDNSALRIRCLRDALYRRYQLAKDEEEYKRFLQAHFDLIPDTYDKPTMLWSHYVKESINHWISLCKEMDKRFVEDKNTPYVFCIPKDKTNVFQDIQRVNEFDIEWKKKGKRKRTEEQDKNTHKIAKY